MNKTLIHAGFFLDIPSKTRRRLVLVVCALLVVLLFLADMLVGSADISPEDVLDVAAGREVPSMIRTVVVEIRLVRALTAVFAGIAVSVCGLLMQTFFRNPLAGPYVLGVNSGACLGAAVFVLGRSCAASVVFSRGTGIALASLGLAGAAWAGAAVVMLLVAWVSRRAKNIMLFLVLGIMFGSGVDALVQLLQYSSDGESLKSYVLWTMGSLGGVTSDQLPLLCVATAAGLFLTAIMIKPLNLLLTGEEYAASMGMNMHRTRICIYIVVVLLAGTVTALCGPIGFLGLAVPHIARWLAGSSDHRVTVPGAALCGAVLMLLCDVAATLFSVPLNVLTSLLGVPMVMWIVFRNRIRL